jgi:AraC-like DNA-binding protein
MIESPLFLLDSPEMGTDPLSDVLKLANVTALLTGGFTAGGPWAIRFPARPTVQFFAVVKGRCWGQFVGEPQTMWFETGDIGLLVEPRSSVLASGPDVVPIKGEDLFAGGRTMATIGDGSEFAYVAGHVEFDQAGRQLLSDVLPPWIHVRPTSATAAIFRWLLDRIVDEQAAGSPGSQIASAQLMQLLFVQILRAHLETRDVMPAGWLRAIADPRLAPALRLMHADPGRAWHLEELAKAAAMSRTTFAERFREAAGAAPLTYLTEWRMRLAERMLREDTSPVALIARSLGYSSESAFSNAFKRVTGKSPRACRNAGPAPG